MEIDKGCDVTTAEGTPAVGGWKAGERPRHATKQIKSALMFLSFLLQFVQLFTCPLLLSISLYFARR